MLPEVNVNKNAQSLMLDAAIFTKKAAPEQVLSKLSPVFMDSIKEKYSIATSSKIKSMLKPRYLIPLAAVVTGTALTILAYQYDVLGKIWSKDPNTDPKNSVVDYTSIRDKFVTGLVWGILFGSGSVLGYLGGQVQGYDPGWA